MAGKLSKAKALRAIEKSPLRFRSSFDELRRLTRETPDAPLVKPRRVKGKLRPPKGFRPGRDLIAAAIRADRDAR